MKSIIRTEACDVLGIVHPIILAPMAGVAGGKLAAAVSNAGGLGMIAIGYSAEKAINEYKVARSLTNKPLGVGFISWKMKDCMEIFEKFLNDFKPEIFWFSVSTVQKPFPSAPLSKTHILISLETAPTIYPA